MRRFENVFFKKTGRISKNRIALAPLTNGQSHGDGTLGEDEFNWLSRRAKGDFGIAITCACHVTSDGQGWAGEMGIFHNKHIPGLTRLADEFRKYNCISLVQIFHGGGKSPREITGLQPWGPSALTIPSAPDVEIREATEDDIQHSIRAFALAAERAEKAGFDGVEIHGAHGYLLAQFLGVRTNLRKDGWGGVLENRARILREVTKEVRKKVSDKFIVGVRISPENRGKNDGLDFDEQLQVANWLMEDGIDYLHVSIWDALKKPEKYPSGKTIVEYFSEITGNTLPLFVAGNVYDPETMEKLIALGATVVALGRVAIGNPDWPMMSRDEKYKPKMPPYTPPYLREQALGESFIEYMRRWPGFVKDV